MIFNYENFHDSVYFIDLHVYINTITGVYLQKIKSSLKLKLLWMSLWLIFRPQDESHPKVKPDSFADNLLAAVDLILQASK